MAANARTQRTKMPFRRLVLTELGANVARGLAVLFVLVAVIVVACSTDDTFLPALLADPMASYQAEGLELSDSWEYPQGTGFLGSGPDPAEVGRKYRIEDQAQAERLLSDTVEFAESQGWSMSRPPADKPYFYAGEKELAPGSAKLAVALGAEDPLEDPEGPVALRIRMNYWPALTE